MAEENSANANKRRRMAEGFSDSRKQKRRLAEGFSDIRKQKRRLAEGFSDSRKQEIPLAEGVSVCRRDESISCKDPADRRYWRKRAITRSADTRCTQPWCSSMAWQAARAAVWPSTMNTGSMRMEP